ncbi:hypothetical protein ACVWY3_005759 [Bradyrhizobium sp. USDA 4486]
MGFASAFAFRATADKPLDPSSYEPRILFRSAGLASRTRGLLTSRSTRSMRRSTWLVLIGYVSGLSGVAGLDPFVRITLHLLVWLASLGPLVYIAPHLLLGLFTGGGLLLLGRCLEGHCASGNDDQRENCCSHVHPPRLAPPEHANFPRFSLFQRNCRKAHLAIGRRVGKATWHWIAPGRARNAIRRCSESRIALGK